MLCQRWFGFPTQRWFGFPIQRVRISDSDPEVVRISDPDQISDPAVVRISDPEVVRFR